MKRRMEWVIWPFMFMCLNGCYGPPQTLRGQVERLPEGAVIVPAEPTPAAPVAGGGRLGVDEQVRLAGEIGDPAAWAERVFASGRPDLTPSRLIELGRRGVPAAHLDALYAREMRAREADCAGRVAEREQYLGRRYEEDIRRIEQSWQAYPAWPMTPMYPYPGYFPGLYLGAGRCWR